MPKIAIWKAKCKTCESPTYYYPVKLLLEMKKLINQPADEDPRIVSCTCTGEKGGVKHTIDYSFPKEFEKQ